MVFVDQHREAVGQGELLVGNINVGCRHIAGEQNQGERGQAKQHASHLIRDCRREFARADRS